MKLKLAILGLVILGSAGCVTGTNSYTRDIVYRDGSYYAPADEQYGDYYYAPEEDYSYYDNYPYYGYNSFYGNSWFGRHDSYGCHFSYHRDRYCDNGRGNIFLNFGGFSLIFGDSHYYGYGYPYYGSYPYYGYYSSPPRPNRYDPIPMPKPMRPAHPTPDYSVIPGPGMRVPGEPIRMPTKPGLVDQDPMNPVLEPDTEIETHGNLNPYTRSRHRLRPVQAEIPGNTSEDNGGAGIDIREPRHGRPAFGDGAPPRSNNRPLPVADAETDGNYQKPIRQERRPQPYPVNAEPQNDAPPIAAATPQVRERVERAERPERIERSERSISSSRQETSKEGDER